MRGRGMSSHQKTRAIEAESDDGKKSPNLGLEPFDWVFAEPEIESREAATARALREDQGEEPDHPGTDLEVGSTPVPDSPPQIFQKPKNL